MNTQTQGRRAPNAALGMLFVGLIAGLAGGILFSGYIPGLTTRQAVPEANLSTDPPGNSPVQDPQPSIQTPDSPLDAQSAGPGGAAPPQGTAQNTAQNTGPDPLAAEALRAILDRRAAEEARLSERARLAFESPLTPSVAEVPERIAARAAADPPRSAGPADQSAAVTTGAGVRPTRPAPTPLVGSISSSTASPASGHILARGSVIPAVLETGLDSDLPGLVRARVSRDVYDSLTGAHILIPRGAQLVGTYRESARSGQKRLFVAWSDLRMPDGTPIDLSDFSTLGQDGAAGVKGKRSTGLLAGFGAAVLFDLAGNATQILTGNKPEQETDLRTLLAGATGTATSRVADRYLGDLLDHGPRFRVSAGTLMNVLVEQDLTLPAWAVTTGRAR